MLCQRETGFDTWCCLISMLFCFLFMDISRLIEQCGIFKLLIFIYGKKRKTEGRKKDGVK